MVARFADPAGLPAADRGRVGVGGPLSGFGQRPQIRLGRLAAGAGQRRQLRRLDGRLVLGGAIPGYRTTMARPLRRAAYQPNPLGLYNLGGNVSEWMHDVYAVTPSPPGEVARDPIGPSEGAYHVIRGASWMDTNTTELRLSYRDYGDSARPDLGFRIARSAQ